MPKLKGTNERVADLLQMVLAGGQGFEARLRDESPEVVGQIAYLGQGSWRSTAYRLLVSRLTPEQIPIMMTILDQAPNSMLMGEAIEAELLADYLDQPEEMRWRGEAVRLPLLLRRGDIEVVAKLFKNRSFLKRMGWEMEVDQAESDPRRARLRLMAFVGELFPHDSALRGLLVAHFRQQDEK